MLGEDEQEVNLDRLTQEHFCFPNDEASYSARSPPQTDVLKIWKLEAFCFLA
jgi:hypothetical protein